jgi:hypothetical protein
MKSTSSTTESGKTYSYKNSNRNFILLIVLMMSSTIFAQTSSAPSDYLNVPGPISFNNSFYNLVWSSHPSNNFYKHEYLVKGDKVESFKSMLMMDVLTGEIDLKNIVGAKLNELKKMKESNPVVNYELIENPKTGEYMIDFLLSANAADGSINIIERNVYRYKNFTDKNGHKGVFLFAVSSRAYGNEVQSFLTNLKGNRQDLMNKVAQFKMPELLIKK